MITRYQCTLQLPTHKVRVNVFTTNPDDVEELAKLKAAKHVKRWQHLFVDIGDIVMLDQKQMESSNDYEPDTLFTSQYLVK